GGKMRRDEGDLKAADKEARCQQEVAAMAERFGERLADRLLHFLARKSGIGIAPQRNGENGNEQHQGRKPKQGVGPSELVDEALADRREQEHAGGARGGTETEDQAALFRHDMTGEGSENNAE